MPSLHPSISICISLYISHTIFLKSRSKSQLLINEQSVYLSHEIQAAHRNARLSESRCSLQASSRRIQCTQSQIPYLDCRIYCCKTSLIAAASAASRIKLYMCAAIVEPPSASSHATRPHSVRDRVLVAAALPAEASWAATQRRFRRAGCRLSIQGARLALCCLGCLQLQLHEANQIAKQQHEAWQNAQSFDWNGFRCLGKALDSASMWHFNSHDCAYQHAQHALRRYDNARR